MNTKISDELRDRMTMTRHRYLLIKAMQDGGGWMLAVEAVATTALAHPEWDMHEKRTWTEWEAG
jgi:hypothetical protein